MEGVLLVICTVIYPFSFERIHYYAEINKEHREKRQVNSLPLVFPYGATYKLLLGFGSPVPVGGDVNLAFVANFQYQYLQFQNISELSQYYFIKEVSREQREADIQRRKNERFKFYRSVADMLDTRVGKRSCLNDVLPTILWHDLLVACYDTHEKRWEGTILIRYPTFKGFNGHECVLRAICESAQFPVGDEGLFGELLHILLTPDYGRTDFDEEDYDWEESMSVYKDAAITGRQMFSCPHIYSGCPEEENILDFFTTVRNE